MNNIPQVPDHIDFDKISKKQFKRFFGDLSPEEKLLAIEQDGNRVRRENPYGGIEDFRNLGVSTTIYYTLTLKVVDDLGNPVENATVKLNDVEAGVTDGNGEFIDTIPSDNHTISVEKTDYSSFSTTIDLDQPQEIDVVIDYEEFRDNDPNTIYWGSATERDSTTLDGDLANDLEHDETTNDLERTVTIHVEDSEHAFYAHPARLGKVEIGQEPLGYLDYEDTFIGTTMIQGSKGEEEYEIHMTPEHSLGEVTINTRLVE